MISLRRGCIPRLLHPELRSPNSKLKWTLSLPCNSSQVFTLTKCVLIHPIFDKLLHSLFPFILHGARRDDHSNPLTGLNWRWAYVFFSFWSGTPSAFRISEKGECSSLPTLSGTFPALSKISLLCTDVAVALGQVCGLLTLNTDSAKGQRSSHPFRHPQPKDLWSTALLLLFENINAGPVVSRWVRGGGWHIVHLFLILSGRQDDNALSAALDLSCQEKKTRDSCKLVTDLIFESALSGKNKNWIQ